MGLPANTHCPDIIENGTPTSLSNILELIICIGLALSKHLSFEINSKHYAIILYQEALPSDVGRK